MESLAEWLDGLGLTQYLQQFKAQEIDFTSLPLLTEEDLRGLGIPLGPRRKLLKAIHELAALTSRDAVRGDGGSNKKASETSAERRQLTVMFCDLVGSTGLSRRVDPETLREVMSAYQRACGAAVEKFEGHVAQYLGDGLMTYFGWPKAHEDDAERSIRAALVVVDAVKLVQAPEKLQVRIGIATGPVVIGETGAGDASVPKVAVGETPNIAARLQSLSAPDEIVISAATRRLVGGAFECTDLGDQALKGVVEPVRAFLVNGLGRVESRFEATRTGELTTLVGREEEVSLLQRRWRAVCDGDGQVALLSGEPGIGKSRVIRELREHLAAAELRSLRCQCSPHYANSALHPFIAPLMRAAELSDEDSPAARADKLERMLRHLSITNSGAPALLAALLSIETSDRYPPSKLSAQRQKEDTLQLLAEIVWRLAARSPLLFVFEDVHWIDPTSLELLDLLVAHVGGHRVLLLMSFRPDFPGRWIGQSNVTFVSLNRLARRQAAAMVARLTGNKDLPDEVLGEIVAKTDGVPLFVEELTKAVLESGLVRLQGGRYALTAPVSSLAIPSTLQDSLMARLDRSAEVREVAQIGACIGRDFSYRLLAAVSDLPEDKLRPALDQLIGSELVFHRGEPPDATYSFKHALVQDTAYGSLLKSRRQALHRLLAEILQSQFPERIASEPELAAHHFTSAGLDEQAIGYWLLAAQRAIERFANTEAISHVSRGLALLAALPAGAPRDKQELLLQMALGSALGAKGYTSQEVGRTFARARELCQQVGEMPQMFPILFGLWIFYIMRAEFQSSHEIADQILQLASKADDPLGILVGNYSLCGTQLFRGDLPAAVKHGEAAFKRYEKAWDKRLMAMFGYSPGPGCGDWASIAMWFLGFVGQSREQGRLAEQQAEESGHPLTLATVLAHRAFLEGMRGDVGAALAYSRRTIEVAKETGILIRQAEGELIEGWALARMGESERGIRQIETSLAIWNQIGANIGDPTWMGFLADAHRTAGQLDQAHEVLARAIECVEKYGERLWESGLHRLQGELWLSGSGQNATRAEACFRKAVDVAQGQAARMLELEAATPLAGLLQQAGRTAEARDVLKPVYSWFTEGFETPQLRSAAMALRALQ